MKQLYKTEMSKKQLFVVGMFLVATVLHAETESTDPIEQRIWSEHFAEMIVPVNFLAEDGFTSLRKQYRIPVDQFDRVHEYCYNREQRKYTYNYLPIPAEQRIEEKSRIDSVYRDSINRVLIPYNPQITGSTIGTVFRNASYLNLSDDKCQVLMEHALRFARRLYRNPCAYIAREEMDVLRKELTHEQLENVINWKNSKEARSKAKWVWQSVRDSELLSQSDSAQHTDRAYLYYLKEMYIRDYYVGEQEIIDNNLTDLYARKPKVIKIYESKGMQKLVEKRHQERVGSAFAW